MFKRESLASLALLILWTSILCLINPSDWLCWFTLNSLWLNVSISVSGYGPIGGLLLRTPTRVVAAFSGFVLHLFATLSFSKIVAPDCAPCLLYLF